MDRHAVALVLDEIATLLDSTADNRFRVRAFRAAARAVDRLEVDLRTMIADGSLRTVAGIGPATASVIEELVTTGESRYLVELRERAPSGMRTLLRVPGLGPKKIALLHERLGIADLDALDEAARTGRIAELPGFGERTQQRIRDGIAFARGLAGRRRRHQAEEAAERLAGYIAALPGVSGAVVAGALRRGLEIVDDIVIVAAARDAATTADTLRHTAGAQWAGDGAHAVHGVFSDGLRVEVRFAPPDRFGAALLLATGAAAHIDALQRIADAAGVDIDMSGMSDEDAVYAALGMQWVPPELREGGTEIDLARAHRLPRLVELADLRGCFHCHTTASDGTAGVREMAEGALALGWRYLCIADHSRNAGYAGVLSPAQLRRQRREIDGWNTERGDELFLFAGIEADILPDGQLDYAAQGDGEVLDALDYVIGSVHSQFRMPRAAMTARVTRAVGDPRLTMLGHATGRLLLTREGYDIDLDAVIDAAARSGAAIEINADPHRLDMSWQHWPRARELGVRCAINPDAHSVAGMRNVRHGVVIARRAALTPADVINAWPLTDVVAYLQSRKEDRAPTH
ncbi:helix-hairpin-helix domain-containing protein [soil metagenome]